MLFTISKSSASACPSSVVSYLRHLKIKHFCESIFASESVAQKIESGKKLRLKPRDIHLESLVTYVHLESLVTYVHCTVCTPRKPPDICTPRNRVGHRILFRS